MFIRIVTGIRTHLPERGLEWVMALNMVWWGWKVAAPTTQWSNAAAWEFMLSFGLSEEAWGWLAVLIGGARLTALIINGTFADTWYSTLSPWVRATGAGAGAIIWFMVFLSVSSAGTSGGGIYQLPLVLDLWCSLRVFFATGRASKGTRGNARLS